MNQTVKLIIVTLLIAAAGGALYVWYPRMRVQAPSPAAPDVQGAPTPVAAQRAEEASPRESCAAAGTEVFVECIRTNAVLLEDRVLCNALGQQDLISRCQANFDSVMKEREQTLPQTSSIPECKNVNRATTICLASDSPASISFPATIQTVSQCAQANVHLNTCIAQFIVKAGRDATACGALPGDVAASCARQYPVVSGIIEKLDACASTTDSAKRVECEEAAGLYTVYRYE